jgi:GTP-binding protein Era
MTQPDTRCGYVALVGRPNVGKSTLLNHLIGQKVSITSRKPQTTRHRVLGIYTEQQLQMIFVDTPGIHLDERRILNRYMNRAAGSTLNEVDAVVFLVDGTIWNQDDELVLTRLKETKCPVILAINKVDKIKDKETLLPHLEALAQRYDFEAVFPLSALKGTNVVPLREHLEQLMPNSEFIYPEDFITDRSMRFMAAETVREKLMRQLGKELPYATTVDIEQYEVDDRGLVNIACVIWVERKGQKQIVIGKQGSRLKLIGQQAREDLEELLQAKVYLQLWVKVKEGWADDERALKSMGFDEHQP